jgi:AAA domain
MSAPHHSRVTDHTPSELDEAADALHAMLQGEPPPGDLNNVERYGRYHAIVAQCMMALAAFRLANGHGDNRAQAREAVRAVWDQHKMEEPSLAQAMAQRAGETLLGRPVLKTMSEVEAEPITWLWWPYLAVGKLCMLDGDPGIGKTLLMTRLAASLSRGEPLPDQQGKPELETGGPHATLVLSTEDGLADTLKPRLEAAGADCTKIHVLTGWKDLDEQDRTFTLDDLPILEEAVRQVRPRLIIIDPIQAYLGPKTDMHRANETRPLLAKLARLAEESRCAVVCIRHPSKPGQGGGKAIHRGLGSIDFIGAARTALFVEQHPADPTKALMAQSKSNIGPLGRTQVYSKDQGQFRWCGVSRLSAEVLAGSGRGPDPHVFLEAVCWLEARLQPEVPEAAKTIEDAMGEEGYRTDTIKRAKKALGIRSTQLSSGGWVWTLPSLPSLPPPLPPPLPLQPPLLLQPPLPPLVENQQVTPRPAAGEGEGAGVEEGSEVAVAGGVYREGREVLTPEPTMTRCVCGQDIHPKHRTCFQCGRPRPEVSADASESKRRGFP